MLTVDKTESEPLSDKEIKALISLAQKGNIEARKKIISHNFRFVVAVVSNMMKAYGNPYFDDLIQQGVFGLDKAISRFDLSKNMRFTTYAVWWIRHSVGIYYRANMSLIRLPDNVACFITNKLKRSNANITEVQTIGGDQFLKALDIPQAENINKALNMKFLKEENREGSNIFDSIAGDSTEDPEPLFNFDELDTRGIPARNLDMLKERFFKEHNFRDMAKSHGISHERVRQIVKRTLEKIKQNNKKFLSF